ncbi:MAG: TrkA family potassium uptake protein [Oscillospiraceae bacterium]
MNILLVGGQQNVHYLLKSLKADGHEVVIINSDYNLCQTLANEYEIIAICGNGTSAIILKEANACKMNIVIALCENDADNLMICETAKKSFQVKSTYATVNNPKNIDVFKNLGVDKCVNPSSILEQLVKQQTIENSITKYFNIKNKDFVIREIQVSKKSSSLNKKLFEIGFPENSNVVSIFRGDEVIIPQGNTQLLFGDRVLIVASSQVLDEAISLLNEKKKENIIF